MVELLQDVLLINFRQNAATDMEQSMKLQKTLIAPRFLWTSLRMS